MNSCQTARSEQHTISQGYPSRVTAQAHPGYHPRLDLMFAPGEEVCGEEVHQKGNIGSRSGCGEHKQERSQTSKITQSTGWKIPPYFGWHTCPRHVFRSTFLKALMSHSKLDALQTLPFMLSSALSQTPSHPESRTAPCQTKPDSGRGRTSSPHDCDDRA